MSSHEIAHLIHEYGLVVVFIATGLQAAGLPVPGGTVLVAAAIDASTKHGLPLIGVILASVLGVLAGTAAGFGLGRWRGVPILLRIGKLLRQEPSRVQALRAQFRRNAMPPLFIARFITGARNVAGIVAGASGMQLRRFLPISLAAAVAWSTLVAVEYYLAGHTLLGAPTWLQIVLIVVGVLATIASFRLVRPRLGAQSEQSPVADVTD